MSTAFETVEKIEEVNVPVFNTSWVGSGGCSTTAASRAAIAASAPASSTSYYEPETVVEIRNPHPMSGRRQRGSPPYFYTPHFVSRLTERRHLVKREVWGSHYDVYDQYGSHPKIGASCVYVLDHTDIKSQIGVKYRNVVSDFVGLSEYTVSEMLNSDVNDAISRVENEVAAEALTSYDLLTDIAEAREIPGLVRSISSSLFQALRALRGRFNISDLRGSSFLPLIQLIKHPNRAFRSIGNHWMEYRYGIMPLVYSYRDALKTLKRGEDVHSRKSAVVTARPTGVTLPSPSSQYLLTRVEGNVTIRGSVFQHFDWESDAQIAGIGFNPLVTAWELIPYSFVVDWFVNVGDYLTRTTSRPLARVHWACISQRSNYTKQTFKHYNSANQTVNTSVMRSGAVWVGSIPSSTSLVLSHPEELVLWKESQVDSYSRRLFDVGDARLSVSPQLNWRRLVDSAVMANNRLRAFGRLFK